MTSNWSLCSPRFGADFTSSSTTGCLSMLAFLGAFSKWAAGTMVRWWDWNALIWGLYTGLEEEFVFWKDQGLGLVSQKDSLDGITVDSVSLSYPSEFEGQWKPQRPLSGKARDSLLEPYSSLGLALSQEGWVWLPIFKSICFFLNEGNKCNSIFQRVNR